MCEFCKQDNYEEDYIEPECDHCEHYFENTAPCCDCGEQSRSYEAKKNFEGIETWEVPRRSRVAPLKDRPKKRLQRARWLGEDVADFYLLEAMANIFEVREAKVKLATLAKNLAAEFAEYLDEIIGGELRHARGQCLVRYPDDFPKELGALLAHVRYHGRERTWALWARMRKRHGLDMLRQAVKGFEAPGWSAGYGGEKWASVAKTLLMYYEGKFTDVVFVDRVFNLQHNGGAVFDKQYRQDIWLTAAGEDSGKAADPYSVPAKGKFVYLKAILDAHGEDNYEQLLRFASHDVSELWFVTNSTHKVLRRKAYGTAQVMLPAGFTEEEWEEGLL